MSFFVKVALFLAGITAASAAVAQQRFTANYCGNPAIQVELIAPTADASPVLRAYEGVWVGKWDSGTCHALVVTGVTRDRVQVHYFYGSGVNVPNPGNWKKEAAMQNGVLTLLTKMPIWYRVERDGTLTGNYDRTSNGRLARTAPSQASL